MEPGVRELEHANTDPEAPIEQMKELAVFGLVVPAPYGEERVSTTCFALVTEGPARRRCARSPGWTATSGS